MSLKNEFAIMAGIMLYFATFPANLILQIIFLPLDFFGVFLESYIFHCFLALVIIVLDWFQWTWIFPRLLSFIFHELLRR